MSNKVVSGRRPRVIFCGMQCAFSYPPLHALLEGGIEVCAIVLPAAAALPGKGVPALRLYEPLHRVHAMLPLYNRASQQSVLQLAVERQIPLWEVQRLGAPQVAKVLAEYQADLICVACFPKRVPRSILELPRLGCVNVHPSLLPANRGPAPLFWTFREGQERTGVTVHLMDERLDTGDILAQAEIEVPDGISYEQLEMRCAELGGALLTQAVWDLARGVAVRRVQDETKSSYHAFPTDEDGVVRVDEWSARHVYNFVQGVATWLGGVTLIGGEEHLFVEGAISYSLEKPEERALRCREGWVVLGASSPD